MAKLRADRKNYKKAFTTHFQAYKSWREGCYNSRRLVLCYCVECGLKCLIMIENNIYQSSQADQETARALGTHDFKILLKAVKKAGIYQFRTFQSEYGDTVTPDNYHQLCRYCINIKENDGNPMDEFDIILDEIAEWLKEVI